MNQKISFFQNWYKKYYFDRLISGVDEKKSYFSHVVNDFQIFYVFFIRRVGVFSEFKSLFKTDNI